MIRYLMFVMILTMAGHGQAIAQERVLGLMDVYSLAKERDALHAASRAARDAGVEKEEQGMAALLPQLKLDGGLSYTDQNLNYKGTDLLRGGHSSYQGASYSLTLVQPIFRMQNMAIYRQGRATARMAEEAMAIADQDIIQRAAAAYLNILLAENTVELIGAQKEAISEHLARAKKSFEVGAASITDTHEAQARFDMVASREVMVRQGLQMAQEEMAKIIGEVSFELVPLNKEFDTPAISGDIEKWTEDAFKNSPYLAIKQKALEVASQEVARMRGERLPAADLVANYNYLNQGGSSFGVGMENTTQSVNLRVSVPLYAGGALSSREREARANEMKARYELEEAQRQVRLWVRGAYLQVGSASAEVNALKQALVSSQSALASTQQGFEVGLRSAVDVLDSQQQSFDARQALASAKYAYLMSLLRLEAAAGVLGEEGLQKVAGYLTQ